MKSKMPSVKAVKDRFHEPGAIISRQRAKRRGELGRTWRRKPSVKAVKANYNVSL